MTNAELHAQTQQNFEEIDKRIDALVDMTSELNVSAKAIGNELEDQTQMLKDTDQNMDKTQEQIDKANDAVLKVKATTGNWIAWILIIVLIVLIIILWVAWN